jgi:hypothetical protein
MVMSFMRYIIYGNEFHEVYFMVMSFMRYIIYGNEFHEV